jgi:hypothetical protein
MKALQNFIMIKRDVKKHAFLELLSTEKQETGIVISTGPKYVDLNVGSHVFGTGQEFSFDSCKYVVTCQDHVLGGING